MIYSSHIVTQVMYNKSSSAHSSVVQRHIEVLDLFDLPLSTKKLVRLMVFRQGPREKTRLYASKA